jgi:ribosomal protein S18 acetylase RimI-like enzyme
MLTDHSHAPAIVVRPADLGDPGDQQGLLELLDLYAQEPLGQAAALSDEVRQRLIPALRTQPGAVVLLALEGPRAAGLAVCFLGFSTFQAQPLLNIHDLVVRPELRGRGVGRALLHAVEGEALNRNCCKLTLEVRADNERARRLYRSFGFESGDDAAALDFWTKPLARACTR